MKEIVYILGQSLHLRNRSRFGIDNFLNFGYHVIIIDLSFFLGDPTSLALNSSLLCDDGIKYFQPSGLSELFKIIIYILNAKPSACLYYSNFSRVSVTIFLILLRLFKIPLVFLTGSIFPSFTSINHNSFCVYAFFKFKQYLRRLSDIFFHPDCFVVISKKHLMRNSLYKSSKLVYAHSFDFDKLLNHSFDSIFSHDFHLFLDEAFTNHPDLVIDKCRKSVSFPIYKAWMSKFVTLHSQAVDLPLVVAKHPKNDYDSVLLNKIYPGIDVISHRTLDLVSDSSLVFCHSSTSVSFAIAKFKPIIFLTSKYIDSLIEGQIIHKMATLLHCPVFYLDSNDNIPFYTQLSDTQFTSYKNYIDDYLCHPNSPRTSIWTSIQQALD